MFNENVQSMKGRHYEGANRIQVVELECSRDTVRRLGWEPEIRSIYANSWRMPALIQVLEDTTEGEGLPLRFLSRCWRSPRGW